MSLRLRLALLSLVSVALALVIGSIAVTSLVRSFLIGQIDGDLQRLTSIAPASGQITAPPPVAVAGTDTDRPTFGDTNDLNVQLLYLAVIDRNGVVERERFVGVDAAGQSPPRIPASVRRAGGTATVDSTGGADQRYRLISSDTLTADGQRLVVALSLNDVDQTMDRLIAIEIGVSIAVLAGLSIVVWWLSGVGLRPLRRVEDAAETIRLDGRRPGQAGGRVALPRVPVERPRSEVGRLATTLNGMLDSIDGAFTAREQSDARLRQFVADAGHELRTPLTSIRGYAELARRVDHDPEVMKSSLARVESEAHRMEQLVEELLLLAQLDEERAILRVPVALGPLVEEVLADARALDAGRQYVTSVSGSATALGDPPRLAQMLINLVANARIHAEGATTVRVTVETGDRHVLLSVSDDGPGVPDASKPWIFDRFTRLDVSRSRHRGGSGIGLSIVRMVAERHHGSVDVIDTPGGGATFRVTLPAAP